MNCLNKSIQAALLQVYPIAQQTSQKDYHNYVTQLMHLMKSMLQLVNRTTRIEILRTSMCAVHNSMTTIQLVSIVQTLQTLLCHLITGIRNPTIGLLENRRTQVLVRMPPIGRAGCRATSTQNTLIQTIQKQTILIGLKILHLVIGVHLCLLLKPGLNRGILIVEVGHVSNQIFNNEHVGKRTNRCGSRTMLNFGQTGKSILSINVHSTRTANTLTARSRSL